VTDPSRYDVGSLTRPRRFTDLPYTTLTSADVKKMLEYGIIRQIDVAEARGAARVFPVFEASKNRRRIIRHTYEINDVLGPETVAPVDMATKKDLIAFVHQGKYLICFDATAFYDQFQLVPAIGARSCFRKGRNAYALTTAPTGQRHIVEVGHTTLQRLIHRPGKRCSSLAIIDNGYFAGETKEDCREDGIEFVKRCAEANCLLNGDTSDIEKLITTTADCGGIRLNMTDKTTCLPDAMVQKVRTSWDLRQQWSVRSFLSHMGLLTWAIGIVTCNPGDYFPALGAFASVCRDLSLLDDDRDRDAFLKSRIVIPDVAFRALEAWTERVVLNEPRRVPKRDDKSQLPDWLACVDSCGTGFGYVALNPNTGEVRTHGQRWPRLFAEKNRASLHRSVFTEPHGVIMSLCHLLTVVEGRVQRVHVWTDSITTMVGGNRGYNGRSEMINDVLRRLRDLFPAEYFDISFAHIPGIENVVADALSRGKEVDMGLLQGAAHRMVERWEGEAALTGF
jgi:hypothetical protein